jgi:predicted negative regulator of RcsB-dependent stress response
MDRVTRHELKQDEFKESLDQLEQFMAAHLKEIVTVAILAVIVVGSAVGMKYYLGEQETNANLDLAAALRTYQAYVGVVAPGSLPAGTESYPTTADRYKAALLKFSALVAKYRLYPRPKAVGIALYHAGLCEAFLGNTAAATNTLQEASREGDRNIASLAQLALADVFLKAGKTPEAEKIYQNLADHPTLTVPRASALLAMAESLKNAQPARARQLYDQIRKEYSSEPSVAEILKEEMADQPQSGGAQ